MRKVLMLAVIVAAVIYLALQAVPGGGSDVAAMVEPAMDMIRGALESLGL
jgi:hypothetical protein